MNPHTVPTASPLFDRDILKRAWKIVQRGGEAAGSDNVTIAMFKETAGKDLEHLAIELRSGNYRPRKVRIVTVRKNHGPGKRRLSIPTVRDRIVQQAIRLILEPALEPTFSDASFAYRAGRSPGTAINRLQRYIETGRHWICETDIQDFFDSIPHELLFDRLAPIISNHRLKREVQAVVQSGCSFMRKSCGIPQGSPLSPLLANFYLTLFDNTMTNLQCGLIRYSDDLILCAKSHNSAKSGLEHARTELKKSGLRLHPEKTRILDARKESVDFVGFRRHPEYLWPTPDNIARFEALIGRRISEACCSTAQDWVKRVNPPIAAFGHYYQLCNCHSLWKRLDKFVLVSLKVAAATRGIKGHSKNPVWDQLKLIRLTEIASGRGMARHQFRNHRNFGYGGPIFANE